MKSFACTECEYKGTTQADLDSHSSEKLYINIIFKF